MNQIRKKKWVVLFGGAGREGVIDSLTELGIDFDLYVVSKGSGKLEKSVDIFFKNNIPVKRINKGSSTLDQYSDCVLLSVGYPYILDKALLDRQFLCLNIHPALLPKYRGGTTGAYVIINGDDVSGSTVHILTSELDAGDIVVQSKVDLDSFDTVRSVQRRVYESEPALIKKAVLHLEQGLKLTKQNPDDATEFLKIRTPEDSEVNPDRSLKDLYNTIRACDPSDFPAFFFVDGEKVCIRLWRPDSNDDTDKL